MQFAISRHRKVTGRYNVLASVAVVSVLLIPSHGLQAQQAGPAALQPIEVRTHLAPRTFTTLSSEMDGKIATLSVREGDRVKRGQTLVTFNCGVEIAKAKKAKTIAEQTASVAAAYARLYKLKARSELEVAEAESNAAAAKAEASVMSEILKRCKIAAPFSGRVFELHVRRHQYVVTRKPLLGLLDEKDLELELIVPSNWLTWLKPKTEFAIEIEELGKSYRGTVTRIGARVDPVSQSIKVKAAILGSHSELIPGMGGRAIFQAPTKRANIER